MGAVELLKAELPTTLHIQTQFATSLPKVDIDPGDFKQIFLTLALRVKDAIGGQGKLLCKLRALGLVRCLPVLAWRGSRHLLLN